MKFHDGDIRLEPQSGVAGEGAVFRLMFPKDALSRHHSEDSDLKQRET